MNDFATLSESALRAELERLTAERERQGASAEELQRAVHDLQVHQVELEMQNRALREAHEMLEESRARYADLFDLAPVMYCTLDERAQIREINQAGVELLGATREQLLGRRFDALVSLEDPAGFREHLTRTLRERQRIAREVVFTPRAGTRVVTQMVSTPMRKGGTECRVAFVDLTERQRIEHERDVLLVEAQEARREAESANRLKDLFIATVSHELRTPLAALLLWEAVLRSPALDEATHARALDAIRQSAQTQSTMIEALLDVARGVSGKLVIDHSAVALAPVVASAVEAVRAEAQKQRIALELVLDPATGHVLGDAVRLGQIVGNLVSNAIKFTPPGGRIDVRSVRRDEQVEITVSDTGQGIAPDYLSELFMPFSQADNTLARAHGGLGLGLAIVRQLVELHGGTVQAESAGQGAGATFTVTLPALDADTPHARATSSAGADVRLDGLRVLVVDDEATMRHGIAVVLRQAGATVEIADSTQAAITLLEQHRCDVVVTDLAMPDADGFELLRRTREREAAGGGHVPMVALTARAYPGDRARALEAGFAVYLPKPTDGWQLIAAVASAAGRLDARR